MAMMFGRFEVQGELSKSDTALIYKAMDTKTNQVVALKMQSLAPLGASADAFVDTLIAEGESARDLAGQNIVPLYGAGEIEGQFCAAMEYIQGNSVANMVARKEGFSIWDLLDITRQVCAGLELAAAKNIVHCSLEPSKIMVQWDGTVKILGYGISNMSLIEAESGKNLGRLMPYCSPEQIRGEVIDLRSNLFTLGAILYEMVVGRKAFDAADAVALVNQIQHEMPPNPTSLNAKIQPGVSALIMKALAKDQAERYQTARELLDALELCKESGKKAATDSKLTTPVPDVAVNSAARAAAASKFVSPVTNAVRPKPPAASPPVVSPVSSVSPKPVSAAVSAPRIAAPVIPRSNPPAAAGAAASATTATARALNTTVSANAVPNPNSQPHSKTDAKSGAKLIGEFEVGAPKSQIVRVGSATVGSAAAVGPALERRSPSVAVDPMMAEPVATSSGKKFSDLAEMPPLKPSVFAPSVPEPAEPSLPEAQNSPLKHEKPRSQPREVAENAFRQVATIPPRLMLYSILGAVGLILVVAIAIFFHVRSEDEDSTAAPRPTSASISTSGSTSRPTSAPTSGSTLGPTSDSTSASNEPAVQTPVAPPIGTPAPPIAVDQPNLKVRQVKKANPNSNRRAPAPPPAPAVVLGEAMIDSSPQGAQFQVDGKSDPSWVTPLSLAGLSPGKHIISVSKTGYSSEIRSVEVFAGSKSSLTLHLSPVNALMVIGSTPPGADVILDGKPLGRVTPVQFAVEKGSHTVLLRKQGFLDETVTADLSPAQNFQYSPALRALGNAADIRTVGKFSKMFGRGSETTAGMGSISIHTQPKGAQVAINQRILDKLSPVDVMLGPGNYILDITLTGFKPVHKVVTVDKGGKAPVDEILERQ